MTRSWILPALTILLHACGHSDAFAPVQTDVGPASTGPDVRLTFNPEQDYWPAWTQDGRGILYSFVDAAHPPHRCIGLLPAAGGTRTWELCDNRITRADTTNSYTAYALGSDGRLLYVETASALSAPLAPGRITVWLADSAAPFRRTALLTLPDLVGGTRIGWLTDVAWTGPASFIALGQDFSINAEPNPPCAFAEDSIFSDAGAVVIGTITAGQLTLALVNGTAGATGYSLAENGASIVFTTRDELRLFKVPVTGGVAAPVATVTTVAGNRLLGLACKASICVVAADAVSLDGCPGSRVGIRELLGVSLASGASQLVRTTGDIVMTPAISPTSGDIVAQIGGNLGHLQTFRGPANGELYLFRGLVP